MNVVQFLTSRNMPILQLSKRAGVSYGTVHRHVRYGLPLSVDTAKKLAAASDGAMTAAEILGLTDESRAGGESHAA